MVVVQPPRHISPPSSPRRGSIGEQQGTFGLTQLRERADLPRVARALDGERLFEDLCTSRWLHELDTDSDEERPLCERRRRTQDKK